MLLFGILLKIQQKWTQTQNWTKKDYILMILQVIYEIILSMNSDRYVKTENPKNRPNDPPTEPIKSKVVTIHSSVFTILVLSKKISKMKPVSLLFKNGGIPLEYNLLPLN